MIPTILRLALLALYGVPLATALDRRLRGAALAGAAFLLGSGAVALELFALSLLRIPWTRGALGVAAIPLFAIACVVTWMRSRPAKRATQPPDPSLTLGMTRSLTSSRAAWILDVALAIPVIAHALFATRRGLYEWDFFGIWGLKARTFFEFRGIDWNFVTSNVSHPDYPLLVPLMFDFHALVSGGWNEHTLGLVLTAYGAALIAVARGVLREEFDSRFLAAVGTFAVVFPALTLWIGLAEGIVMAYGCAGLIFIRRGWTAGVPPASPSGVPPDGETATRANRADGSRPGWRAGRPQSIHLGAILLGLAAWSKNEGLALLGVALVSLLLCRRWREAIRLWPGFAVIAPWMIVRARLDLRTDFVDSEIVGRMLARLHDPATLKVFVKSPPDQPLFWIVTIACLVVYARRIVDRERFLTLTLALQMALFIVQGIATRADLSAHVSLTMNRIPQQIAPACAFLAVVLVLPDLAKLWRGSQSKQSLSMVREQPGPSPRGSLHQPSR